MAVQTKKSVLAIVEEVTEATPVVPTAGTQYIALQDGFDIDGAQETLENAELTGSIGAAKPIQGFETPSASLDHYVRHSGVEGQEPGFGLLMEAAMGDKSVASVQYDTVAASTTSVINVDVGEGASFERGEALLIKDGTNGYNIRPIESISGDVLTLGFKLPTGAAPALGVNLGKCVLYKPGEAHPSFSIWGYRANGGAVELIAGSRVTEMSVAVEAGQLINGSFSMEGVAYYFNPVNITSADRYLDFLDNVTTRAAVIEAKMYKDPKDVAEALQTSMNSLGSANTFVVSYSDTTGKYTISSNGTTLSLLWNTGANTANTIGDKIGFSVAADDTGSLSYVSDNAYTLTAPQTPSFDSANPLVAKDNEVLIGGSADVDPACFCAQSLTVTVANEKTDVMCICAESGKQGSLVTGRQVTIDIVGTLSQYEVDKFHRFHTSQNTGFLFAFGSKSGGNWEAGKSGYMYIPDDAGVISAFKLGDSDGLVTVEMTITAFVASGRGEFYLGFV